MSAFLTIAAIHLLGMISPGPDFAMITRNSLIYSKRTGILTAMGLGLGMLLHATYSLLGIGLVISQSIILYTTIKWIGALYLIYIGWKSLRSRPAADTKEAAELIKQDLTPFQAVRTGFLCNALNPKATLFIVALFTQVIDPATPLLVQAFYGLYMGIATTVWFSGLASVFSLNPIRRMFSHIQIHVERVMGIALIALGIRVALSSRD